MSSSDALAIKAPDFREMTVRIAGDAPYVQHRFGHKAMIAMLEKQMQGSRAGSRKQREARDPDDDYRQAMHVSRDGWYGIPATAFRAAMVSACRSAGYVMTKAKQAFFVVADGYGREDRTPLVRILEGQPERFDSTVRLETGVASVAIRPLWEEWQADVTIRYDADMLNAQDVLNLLMRAGMQVGIGEGRPDSKKSVGCGWGTFRIVEEEVA